MVYIVWFQQKETLHSISFQVPTSDIGIFWYWHFPLNRRSGRWTLNLCSVEKQCNFPSTQWLNKWSTFFCTDSWAMSNSFCEFNTRTLINFPRIQFSRSIFDGSKWNWQKSVKMQIVWFAARLRVKTGEWQKFQFNDIISYFNQQKKTCKWMSS